MVEKAKVAPPVWSEKTVKLADLRPYERNPRLITKEAYDRLKAAIAKLGFHQRILCQPDLGVIGGHQRLKALKELGYVDVNILVPDRFLSSDEFRQLLIQDNLPFGQHDFDILSADFDMEELKEWGMPESWFGEEKKTAADKAAGSLIEKFGVAPFSVLNAREGWWQDRKRGWLATGIDSELGRDASAGGSPDLDARQNGKSGTSIFDPVLTELAYRWFSPVGGIILDPFAGGSVRGIVAAKLGRSYFGGDLRAEQIAANQAQTRLLAIGDTPPVWKQGDSLYLKSTFPDVEADFLFSCPPYADLEKYSDDPRDLSNMKYKDFCDIYGKIILAACGMLKQDRFACFVVGEVRDKKGIYRDFVGETIRAFEGAGLDYYNEAILVTACGSVALRAGKSFSQSRKLGKTHQNVLVFVKGDPKKAAEACGEVELDDALFEAPPGNQG